MINKKVFSIVFIILILILGTLIFILFKPGNNDFSESCFIENYNDTFNNLQESKLNTEYNFSKIFNCEDWDEIIFVGEPITSRVVIYLKEGVILPQIDFSDREEGTVLIFFIKDNKVISSPISLENPNLIFSPNLNRLNYLALKREQAVFTFKDYENDHFELFILELNN